MISDTQLLIEALRKELSIDIPIDESGETARQMLFHHINHLIDKDFEKLILILYRIDVHEDKLRKMLYDHPTDDAAMVIADLIIDRQLQKIKTRQEFSRQVYEIAEEEKW